MKLELKHLSAYLPYDLRVFSGDSKVKYKLTSINTYKHTYSRLVELSQSDSRFYEQSINYCKPILRPLSDLTNEIEVNGARFIPADELLKNEYKLHFQENTGKYSIIDYEVYPNYIDIYCKYNAGTKIRINLVETERNPLFIIQKLLEWHFDISGLIENGIAVDIKSL